MTYYGVGRVRWPATKLSNCFRTTAGGWSARGSRDPEFFEKLSAQQTPKYLWIGCSDARVPANEVVGLAPGALFVHRNIGNVVVHTDFNVLSVIQFAVEVLAVRDVIVCGHYGCGGGQAAVSDTELGLADHWIRHIKDVRDRNERILSAIEDEGERIARLCELNVVSQVHNVCTLPVIQGAWFRGRTLTVHGFIYDFHDGILRDLHISTSGGGRRPIGACSKKLRDEAPIVPDRMSTRGSNSRSSSSGVRSARTSSSICCRNSGDYGRWLFGIADSPFSSG